MANMLTASLRRTLCHRSTILSAWLGILLVYTILHAGTPTEYLKVWPLTSTTANHDSSPSTAEQALAPPTSLAALCSRTRWRPHLALHCSSHCGPDRAGVCGGLNNARDRLQTCARLAIDAGAAALVVPSVVARSESALWTVDPSQVPGAADGEPVVRCADVWFSTAALRRALGAACPQLRVEAACPPGGGLAGAAALVGVAAAAAAAGDGVLEMPWRPMGGERFDARPGHSFREAVDRELGAERARELVAPVLVSYGDPYIACVFPPRPSAPSPC